MNAVWNGTFGGGGGFLGTIRHVRSDMYEVLGVVVERWSCSVSSVNNTCVAVTGDGVGAVYEATSSFMAVGVWLEGGTTCFNDWMACSSFKRTREVETGVYCLRILLLRTVTRPDPSTRTTYWSSWRYLYCPTSVDAVQSGSGFAHGLQQ